MTDIRQVWTDMINRCHCRTNGNYYKYGQKGIIVCERWRNSFEDFVKDMGNRPHGYQIDRIDNNGNYDPTNCRWANRRTQQNNRSNNVKLTVNGQTKSIAEWSLEVGIGWQTIKERLKRGWTHEKAIKTPLALNKSHPYA